MSPQAFPASVLKIDRSILLVQGGRGPAGSPGPTGPEYTETFETISKNLKAYPYVLAFNAGKIETITYDLGSGQTIVKTFTFSGDLLSVITLSGDTPNGISLNKSLSYTGTILTGVSYS